MLQGLECTEEMGSVSKFLPLNQWAGESFFTALESAQVVADPNRKGINIYSIPQVY